MNNYTKIILKSGKEKSIQRFHPWVFSGAIEAVTKELNNGDIVFARTGATVGKSYMVDNIDCLSIYASYLIRIRPVENVYPQYIKAFFESSYYWQQISARSVGIGQPNVNGFSLRHIIFGPKIINSFPFMHILALPDFRKTIL